MNLFKHNPTTSVRNTPECGTHYVASIRTHNSQRTEHKYIYILGVWFTYYVSVLINFMTPSKSRTRASISGACWDFFLEQSSSCSLWKCGYLRKLTNPALCSVGNKLLLLYTFVTVKNIYIIEWSCAIRLPWNVGTKVEVPNPLSEDGYELKRNCELFLFDYLFSLPAISSNFIFFFCTDPCASRDLIEQITESSELDFLEIYPLLS